MRRLPITRNLLDELEAILAQIAASGHGTDDLVRKAVEIVGELRASFSGSSTALVRGVAELSYAVERGANGESLTERRKSGTAKPFRCPKPVYDALVQVFGENDRALPLDELVPMVGQKLGDQPPDFQVRVPLRLWMHLAPPLLLRNRARYRPADAETFVDMANDLWDGLRK